MLTPEYYVVRRMSDTKTIPFKIASVSLSQIVYDYAHNFRNFRKAIDLAVLDHADLLATQELSGTAYEADDYHQWNKNNEAAWIFLMAVARYAEEKDPNLVVTVGIPWHYADKSKPASDPEYNINNRPFNAHAIIKGGRVIAISAKSILADGPAEYEARQFNNWPLSKGTIKITLPDGSEVPFGKPIVFLGDGKNYISLTNEICAEGWPGVSDNLIIDTREQMEARHIIALAKECDLSIVLNPSASKPQPLINKERIRTEGLCLTGSRHCSVYVYTNYLGSASGTLAAEGSQIFAQKGRVIHHGRRYSFKDASYSSVVVDVAVALRGQPDVFVSHNFHGHETGKVNGSEADFDKAFSCKTINSEQLTYEEYMRSIALWLRDYLAKPSRQGQGYLVSLSGGKDSAFGAVAVTTMIDLDIKENGIEGFFKRFYCLRYKDEVLKIYAQEGHDAAVRALKRNFLTCLYLPTDNSSSHTLHAAQFLIEGGELPDGTHVKGIGGKFYVAPVQAILEEIMTSSVGLDITQIAQENLESILGERMNALLPDEQVIVARAKLQRTIKDYIDAPLNTHPQLPEYVTSHCYNRMPTWANPADDLNLQNPQARSRLPVPWTVASYEGKMSLTTSNESEAVHSYTTAGGDMHMGGANPIGGMPKHAITQSLAYFEEQGLVGLQPVRSLYWVNNEKPSAELRKVTEGAVEQTDESDLGFSYKQSEFIEQRLIVGRQMPYEVLVQMLDSKIFSDDPAILRDILIGFTKRWESGQFKRIMAPLAPHVGSNVDPHQAVRTTVLGDHFRTGCAHMTLEVIAELSGGPENFKQKFGYSLREAKNAASLNSDFKSALTSAQMHDLLDQKNWQAFEAGNRDVLSYVGPSEITDFSRPRTYLTPSPSGV
jgi:NH3-dependent NAD+ synthetase